MSEVRVTHPRWAEAPEPRGDAEPRRGVGGAGHLPGSAPERIGAAAAPRKDGVAGERPAGGGGGAGRRSPFRGVLGRALSSRRALREAVVLREILGPPKALQSGAGEALRARDGGSGN